MNKTIVADENAAVAPLAGNNLIVDSSGRASVEPATRADIARTGSLEGEMDGRHEGDWVRIPEGWTRVFLMNIGVGVAGRNEFLELPRGAQVITSFPGTGSFQWVRGESCCLPVRMSVAVDAPAVETVCPEQLAEAPAVEVPYNVNGV